VPLRLCEDRPSGFHDREHVHLSDHDSLEQAWSALVQRELLFHEQLRRNAEGGRRASIRHLIVDAARNYVLVRSCYAPGPAPGPYVAMALPPWLPMD
jgi:hypothetical protein